ncbi:MAG: outer membrane beta-barrel protein [Terracidiphilus sp.]
MKGLSCLALTLFLYAGSTWSQTGPAPGDVPSANRARAEVFGGFSFAGGGASQAGFATGIDYGFNGGADFRLRNHIFLVGDVSQYNDPTNNVDTSSDTVFLFGPRYLVALRPQSRVSLFGEFLAGGNAFHNSGQSYTFLYNSATTFAFAAEGGLDYAWSRHWSTRFEGGFLHSTLDYSTYGGPAVPATAPNSRGRFAADVVYRF